MAFRNVADNYKVTDRNVLLLESSILNANETKGFSVSPGLRKHSCLEIYDAIVCE
jgi:hypothetical protein